MQNQKKRLNTDISIVIVTRNRLENIKTTLKKLSDLEENPEIIIVDNNSTDGTQEYVLSQYPNITYIYLNRNTGCGGRNIGMAAANTPLVAFCDDDSWWLPGSLSRAVEIFQQYSKLALLNARILVGETKKLDPTCIEMANSPLPQDSDLPGPPILGFVACGIIVRKNAILSVGGFLEKLGIGGEEELLALDLVEGGWGLAYVDDVIAHHYPTPNPDRNNRIPTMVRNTLWTAWLKRPFISASDITLKILKNSIFDKYSRQGLIEAMSEIKWVFKNRKVIDPETEQLKRLLEQ